MSQQLSFDLFVPDRFEPLRERAEQQLGTIVVPVDASLDVIDAAHVEMRSAGRGALLVLRGDSGTGKSTFLHTVGMFRDGVTTESISASEDVRESLGKLKHRAQALRILVLEEREALKDIAHEEIERDLHAINGFVRSAAGRNALIVWPCNTDNLTQRVVSIGRAIGGNALVANDEAAHLFAGPHKTQFRQIAANTVATLNQGASLSDLGISEEQLQTLIEDADTVGKLLGGLRSSISKGRSTAASLVKKEQCKLWIIVSAGNDPDGDVAALTRGTNSSIDIERMMASTDANIVRELKAYPEKLGILATVMDARIFHLPVLTALDVAREFSADGLRAKMKRAGMAESVPSAGKSLDRIAKSALGRALSPSPAAGVLSTRKGIGTNTKEAFKKLSKIAQNDDIALNRAFGEALKRGQFVSSFQTEKDFGTGLARKTDLCCESPSGIIRIELMWRERTGRAEIANYALTKLYNYGRAIGFLDK